MASIDDAAAFRQEVSYETVASRSLSQMPAAAPTDSLQGPTAVRGSHYPPTASGPPSAPVGLAPGMLLSSPLAPLSLVFGFAMRLSSGLSIERRAVDFR
jgi:hypothetical protein